MNICLKKLESVIRHLWYVLEEPKHFGRKKNHGPYKYRNSNIELLLIPRYMGIGQFTIEYEWLDNKHGEWDESEAVAMAIYNPHWDGGHIYRARKKLGIK